MDSLTSFSYTEGLDSFLHSSLTSEYVLQVVHSFFNLCLKAPHRHEAFFENYELISLVFFAQ